MNTTTKGADSTRTGFETTSCPATVSLIFILSSSRCRTVALELYSYETDLLKVTNY